MTEKKTIQHQSLRILLGILAIEGIISAVWLFLLPKDPGGAILGLSPRRLILLAAPLFSVLLSIALLILLTKKNESVITFFQKFNSSKVNFWIFLAAVALSMISWSTLFFYHLLNSNLNPYISERVLPLTVWLFLTSFSIILFYQNLTGKNNRKPKIQKRIILPFILIAAVLALIIFLTGLGLHTKNVTVNDLGVPMLEWQIIFILGLSVILLYAENGQKVVGLQKNNKNERIKKLFPVVLFLILWVGAVVLWVRLPLPESNYFAPEKLPPNFETYPFSDAERYSIEGQRIMSGAIDNLIISKPLHTVYLALLYTTAGLDYASVIMLQSIILALFPAILYLIGREVHSDILGIGMGLFAIFREANGILASDIANVANSKLLMSDSPSMLIISILILFTIRWIKRPQKAGTALLLGGILGTLVLYRAQYLILLPIFVVLALFLYKKDCKSILTFCGLFLLCLSAAILPVLIRNYSISSFFWFDAPEYISGFSENYVNTGLEDPAIRSSGLFASFLNPDYLFDVGDNFFRNLISTFLIFPIRIDGSQSLQQLAFLDNNFWAEAFSYNHPLNVIIAGFNLFIITIGLTAFTKDKNKAGITCLAFYVLVNFSASLFRFSGWRFIMPVDWLIYPVFILGFWHFFESLHILPIIGSNIDGAPSFSRSSRNFSPFRKNTMIVLCFLIMGSIIPLRGLFPDTYVSRNKSEICADIGIFITGEKNIAVRDKALSLCNDASSTVIEGDVIHPRYFHKGYGFYDRPDDLFFGVQDFSRLVFRVLDSKGRRMFIPIKELKESFTIPNGTRSIILAESGEQHQASILIRMDAKNKFIFADGFLDLE